MMDTVLNLGLNPDTVAGLIALTGNERFGYDAWRRFVAMFGRIVLDIPATTFDEPFDALKERRGAKLDTDLTADDLREAADAYRAIVRDATGEDFPTDPYRQLELAVARRLRLAGSASARTTTASSTRSRTTWAPR